MMPVPVLLLLLAANPQPIRLAAPPLTAVAIPAERAAFYTEQLAAELASRGVEVITAEQIKTVIAVERQRQLLGCSDDQASCLAELADALGTDGVVSGTAGKIEGALQVSVKVSSSRDGRELGAVTARGNSEQELLDGLVVAARSLAREVAGKLQRPLGPPRPAAWAADARLAAKARHVAFYPGGAGVLLLGAGVAALLQTRTYHERLRTDSMSLEEARVARERGELFQALSLAGLGLGALGLAGAGAIWFSNPNPPRPAGVTAALAPVDGGAAVVLNGAWR